MVNSSLNNNLFAWNDPAAGSRDCGREQCVGLFNPLGKIERGLKIIGINEILLPMWSAGTPIPNSHFRFLRRKMHPKGSHFLNSSPRPALSNDPVAPIKM
jgi:hypothetical protein